MGTQARRVFYTGTEEVPSLLIEFTGGRRLYHLFSMRFAPLSCRCTVRAGPISQRLNRTIFRPLSGIWSNFSRTGEIPVPMNRPWRLSPSVRPAFTLPPAHGSTSPRRMEEALKPAETSGLSTDPGKNFQLERHYTPPHPGSLERSACISFGEPSPEGLRGLPLTGRVPGNQLCRFG